LKKQRGLADHHTIKKGPTRLIRPNDADGKGGEGEKQQMTGKRNLGRLTSEKKNR